MVWDRDHVGPATYDILERPAGFEVRAKRKRKPKLTVVPEAAEAAAA